MIKTSPYSKTKGSEKFKDFLALSFTLDMLYPIFNEKSTETLFEGWHSRGALNGWTKFTSDDYTLEFYPTYYTIKKNKPQDSVTYMLSIPVTINDFINDMDRFGIQLYWTSWIDENFEPKEYLNKDEIEQYFVNLLLKMGKSNELL